jgi:hypothetical protein
MHTKRAEFGIDDLESLSKRAIDGERHLFRRTGGRSPSPPKGNKVTDAFKKAGRAVSRGASRTWNRVAHPNRARPVSNIQGPIFIFLSTNGTLSDSQSSQSANRPAVPPVPGRASSRGSGGAGRQASPRPAGPPPGYRPGDAASVMHAAGYTAPGIHAGGDRLPSRPVSEASSGRAHSPAGTPPPPYSGGVGGAGGAGGARVSSSSSGISGLSQILGGAGTSGPQRQSSGSRRPSSEAGPSGTQGRPDSGALPSTERGRRQSPRPRPDSGALP